MAENLDQSTRARAQQPGKTGPLRLEKIASVPALHEALKKKRAMPVLKLGDLLLELGLINSEQLDVALQLQRHNSKKHLGEILVDFGALTRDELFGVLCQKLGIPLVDLGRFQIDPKVLKSLPDDLVRQSQVMPICYDEGRLVVAVPDPLDGNPLERVRFYTQTAVTPVMATLEDIERAIRTYYGAVEQRSDVQEIAEELHQELKIDSGEKEDVINETDSTLVRLVNKVILDAHTSGASDIHVEANVGKESVLIRFRNDGVLSEYLRLPYNFRAATISRLKIMAGMDISERRRSQDGRISFREFGGLDLELRVVTVPTRDSIEDVVMRLLAAKGALPVEHLGLSPTVLQQIRSLIARPYGLILAAGPTGSGKTTTLHSLISLINEPGTKIWTAENPVEIIQPGLRQVQVNPKIGWDFATIMRTFLRADPDVIMVGEMRDQETAGIGIEASLTGHLVLSTLHTNNSAETVVRLLDMGIDPFSFGDSLLGVLAQRLTRRLCQKCRGKRPAAPGEIEALAEEYCYDTGLDPAAILAEWKTRLGGPPHMYEARGCEECRRTGYRGRIGIFELLVVTPAMRTMILHRAPATDLRTTAIGAGMRTLKQDGIEKCLIGETDMLEVRAAAY